MMSVRQALDRISRDPVGDPKEIHGHHAQTIRRRRPATEQLPLLRRDSCSAKPEIGVELSATAGAI
jgi:hypothetical protein